MGSCLNSNSSHRQKYEENQKQKSIQMRNRQQNQQIQREEVIVQIRRPEMIEIHPNEAPSEERRNQNRLNLSEIRQEIEQDQPQRNESGSSEQQNVLNLPPHILLLLEIMNDRNENQINNLLFLTRIIQLMQNQPQHFSEEQIQKLRSRKAGKSGEICSVCQDEIVRGEIISILTCQHQFHNECLKPWLKRSVNCPVCRRRIQIPSDN